MLLEFHIFLDITPFRLVTGVSENVITLEISLNIAKITLRNFPEILIFVLKLFITYIFVFCSTLVQFLSSYIFKLYKKL